MSLHLQQLAVGPMQNFSYLIFDELSREAAIVDPGWDAAKICACAEQLSVNLVAAWLTHSHFDHAKALPGLFEVLGKNLPIFVHEAEADLLPLAKTAQEYLQRTHEGSELLLGQEKTVCWHTPGHSPGSQCFVTKDFVVTGDTLFVGACGRADLPGSSPRKLTESLKRLSTLPEATLVYSGHDYGDEPVSTIGQEKRTNSFMQNAMRLRE